MKKKLLIIKKFGGTSLSNIEITSPPIASIREEECVFKEL